MWGGGPSPSPGLLACFFTEGEAVAIKHLSCGLQGPRQSEARLLMQTCKASGLRPLPPLQVSGSYSPFEVAEHSRALDTVQTSHQDGSCSSHYLF